VKKNQNRKSGPPAENRWASCSWGEPTLPPKTREGWGNLLRMADGKDGPAPNASLNLRDGGPKPATKSIGRCAQYVRLALAAGGITVTPSSAPAAADYVQILPILGFQFVAIWDSQSGYAPQAGDVAVFGATFLWPNPHPYGHIEGYDGSRWVSDFKQRGFIPYKVKSSAGPSMIYRYPFLSGN